MGRASFKPHLRLKMKGWAVEGGELVLLGKSVRVGRREGGRWVGVGVHHTSLVVVVRWKLGDEMEQL